MMANGKGVKGRKMVASMLTGSSGVNTEAASKPDHVNVQEPDIQVSEG